MHPEENISERLLKHQSRMVELRICLWTDNLAVGGRKNQPKHAWTSGVVQLGVNRPHGIESSEPAPFNALEDIPSVLEQLLASQGVGLHVGTPFSDSTRRSSGRMSGETVTTSLGTVKNISAGGMMVECSRVPRGVIEVTLESGGASMRLKAKAVWGKKVGLFRYQVGLEFLGLNDDITEQLLGVQINSRIKRVI